MTAEPTRKINQTRGHNLLSKAAGGCAGALNSFLVVLGDKCGLYATGQYSFDVEEPNVCRKAPSIARTRNSTKAADGPAPARSTAIRSNDRATSVQREEATFMTLICHDCSTATDSHVGTSVMSGSEVWSKALVVDDDASVRDVVAEELRYRGYWVVVARSGSEALECLDLVTPDVIVLDLMMPVMDGWTFVERCRNQAGRRSVPIIAMSAAGDLPPGYEALGVTTLLRKPLDLNELANCVTQLARARNRA